jgi:hypothetical protein
VSLALFNFRGEILIDFWISLFGLLAIFSSLVPAIYGLLFYIRFDRALKEIRKNPTSGEQMIPRLRQGAVNLIILVGVGFLVLSLSCSFGIFLSSLGNRLGFLVVMIFISLLVAYFITQRTKSITAELLSVLESAAQIKK